MSELDNQTNFNGFAKVEINGHNTHIGFVTTQVFGAAVLFRIDQPEIPEDSRVTERDGYIEGRLVPKGTTVKRAGIPAATVLVGAGSIYRITPCTEAAAKEAILQNVYRALIPVGLPDEVAQLPAPDDADDDLCGTCGETMATCQC